MVYEDIFYENEFKYRVSNRKIMQEFISDFFLKTRLNINEFKKFCNNEEDSLGLFVSLKAYIYMKHIKYMGIYYDLLNVYNYRMVHDIFDSMYALRDFSNRNFVLISPNIRKVKRCSQDKIKIYSENYGNYCFSSIYDYFKNDWKVLGYLEYYSEDLSRHCHNMSWDFINRFVMASLITVLNPYCFVGTHYHSVVRDNNGMIVDLANEIVYDESVINNLLQSHIVCETKYEDLADSLYNAINDINNNGKKFYKPLLLALHKQSLERKDDK